MRLAAIDVSTWWAGLALVEVRDPAGPPALVREVGDLVRGSHAARLLVLLERLLADASWPVSSLDAYAATRGPGSFTGLRIGLGTIRGLGLASGRPCLGVGTLHAMAEAFGPSDRERVPLLDAGRGDVFAARYDAQISPPREQVAPWVGAPERLANEDSQGCVAFGPGADVYRQSLERAGFRGRFAAAGTSVAAGAGRIAAARLLAGAADGEGLVPLYVRPADAEVGSSGFAP